MMIINKEGKLFGKISIIDIAVVLIIILLAVGIFIRFGGSGSSTSVTSGEKIKCVFLIKNIRTYSVDALKKSAAVYDQVSKEYIGDITDVRVEDGLYQVNMADGSFQSVVPEDKYNVYVTVVFDGKSSDAGYYTAANKYLAPGSTLIITTKYAQCESTVYSIGKAE